MKHWTQEEKNWLAINYPKNGAVFCARQLNRSTTTIRSYARRHNICIDWLFEEKTGLKTCGHCKLQKFLQEFHKNQCKQGGYSAICKLCKNAQQAISNRKHASHINAYHRQRRKADPIYQIISNCRSRLTKVLKNGHYKKTKTFSLIGCSPEFLKTHLELQFKVGMSWDNYGQWHIDHIKPCASFDLSDFSQQAVCFHFSNLQPLWAKENLQKGAKV